MSVFHCLILYMSGIHIGFFVRERKELIMWIALIQGAGVVMGVCSPWTFFKFRLFEVVYGGFCMKLYMYTISLTCTCYQTNVYIINVNFEQYLALSVISNAPFCTKSGQNLCFLKTRCRRRVSFTEVCHHFVIKVEDTCCVVQIKSGMLRMFKDKTRIRWRVFLTKQSIF